MINKKVNISGLITESGIFSDGDWIESKDQSQDGDVKIIQLADIGDGEFINKSNRFLTYKNALRLNCTFLRDGDILLARMPNPLGRACIFRDIGKKAVTTVDIAVIRPNNVSIDNIYLKFLINSFQFRQEIQKYITGTTRKRISRKNLDKIKFDIPSYATQQKIANLLTQIETLITKRKESIELLDELVKNSFYDMFIYEKDRKTWEIQTVEKLVQQQKRSMRTGPFGSNLLHSEFMEEGEVAVLGIDNVVSNQFKWGKKRFINQEKYQELIKYTVFPNDVLITIMGTVGCSVVVPKDIPLAINTKHLVALTLDTNKINPYFFSYSIYSDPKILFQLKNKMRGAIMDALNLTIIKKVKFHIPDIKLQDRFASIFQQVEASKQKYQDSLNELNELFLSLSQKAFKGELDLSKLEIPEMQNEDIGLEEIRDTQEVYNKVSENEIYESHYLNNTDTIIISPTSKENLETYIFNLIKSDTFSIEKIKDDSTKNFTYDEVKKEVFQMLEDGKIKQIIHEYVDTESLEKKYIQEVKLVVV